MRALTLGLALLGFACAPGTPVVSPSPANPGNAAAPAATASESPSVGVLVMAHGGTPEWNASVTEAVAELRTRVPMAVAYGMANPMTLAPSLDSLRAQGVDRVAVVRMFLSGQSFLHQTGWYLGFEDTPPEQFVLMGPAASNPTARAAIEHDLEVATHLDGLLDAEETGRILAARAAELAVNPSEESVLLLAHGAGDDVENAGLVARIDGYAQAIRDAGFAAVMPATLREDWDEAREVAEAQILDWTDAQAAAGRDVLVVPVRLSGFGPYAEVFGDREYRASEGLLPHPIIAEWVTTTADRVACSAGWGPVTGDSCPTPRGVMAEVMQTPESHERR